MNIDFAILYDGKRNELLHYGRKGMKHGEHLFGDRDYTPIGTKAEAIERGAARGEEAANMESWDLKDKTDRMKLESDYRKYAMEEETLQYEVQDKIKKAKEEKVRQVIADVALGLNLVKNVVGITKDTSSMVNKHRENLEKRLTPGQALDARLNHPGRR